jgi:hypothetical protein
MAFSKSPHQLTHVQSIRVPTDFPKRVKLASAKAGIPNGALLSRLVDQYLADGAPDLSRGVTTAAISCYTQLGQLLGIREDSENSNETPNLSTEPTDEATEASDSSTDPAEGFWSGDHEGD